MKPIGKKFHKRLKKVAIYVFPLYITVMEQIIRVLFGHEAFSISTVSSNVSVAGLALLLPFLIPIPISSELTSSAAEELRREGMLAYRGKDLYGSMFAWNFLVSLTFLWIFSLSKKAEAMGFQIAGIEITAPQVIAFSIYFIGILLTEYME